MMADESPIDKPPRDHAHSIAGATAAAYIDLVQLLCEHGIVLAEDLKKRLELSRKDSENANDVVAEAILRVIIDHVGRDKLKGK